MLLAGDAIAHTQLGNNNAYCQDNEISWIDWEKADAEFLAFVRKVIALRTQHPVFRRRNFFQGRAIKGMGVVDILWLRPDGLEMTDEQWRQESAQCLGVFLSGKALDEQDERAQPITDDNFLLLMNAHHEETGFVLAPLPPESVWVVLVDTSCQTRGGADVVHNGAATYPLQPRSLVLLMQRNRNQVRREDRRQGTVS
jgi:glycogen operon protein